MSPCPSRAAPGQPPTLRSEAADEPGRQCARPRGRPPAGQGPHQAARRLPGTAVLVVVVGLLGLRVLGQSNDRVERIGALQHRALAYGQLQSDARHVRLLLAENVAGGFYIVNNLEPATASGSEVTRGRPGDHERRCADRAATTADRLGLRAARRGRRVPSSASARQSTRLAAVMRQRSSPPTAPRLPSTISCRSATRPSSSRSTSISSPRARQRDDRGDRRADRRERELVHEPRATSSSPSRPGRSCSACCSGFVLSWSLIGPIQRIDSRLARDRLGRLLGPRRRHQPRRAGRARPRTSTG